MLCALILYSHWNEANVFKFEYITISTYVYLYFWVSQNQGCFYADIKHFEVYMVFFKKLLFLINENN